MLLPRAASGGGMGAARPAGREEPGCRRARGTPPASARQHSGGARAHRAARRTGAHVAGFHGVLERRHHLPAGQRRRGSRYAHSRRSTSLGGTAAGGGGRARARSGAMREARRGGGSGGTQGRAQPGPAAGAHQSSTAGTVRPTARCPPRPRSPRPASPRPPSPRRPPCFDWMSPWVLASRARPNWSRSQKYF